MKHSTRSLLTGAMTALLALASTACPDDPTNPPPPPSGNTPKVTSFTANPMNVPSGGKTTLSWAVENATGITISAEPGGQVTSSANASGSVESAALTQPTRFTLTAMGAGGTMATATVNVTIDTQALAITRFEAQPNPAPLNGSTNLVWTCTGATMVEVFQGSTNLTTKTGAEALSGSFRVTLTAPESTFRLVASGGGNTQERMVTVRAEEAPELVAFSVTPQVFAGASQAVSVTYTARKASSINLLANGTAAAGFPMTAPTATVSITVTQTTMFELVVSSGGGEVRARATVAKTSPEAEPNNTFQTATALQGGAAGGTINPAADEDWYSFAVPATGNVFAETLAAQPDGSCLDTIIELFGPDGTTSIARNDDASPGNLCSRIDPRLVAGPQNLAAGTYYLKVTAFSATATGAYALAVNVGTAACGNGVLETNEQCDDGNTTNGDRCSATCMLEVDAEISGAGGMATLNVAPDEIGLLRVTVTANQGISATTKDAGGQCAFDTVLALFDSNLVRLGVVGDDGAMSDCAVLRFPEDGFNVNLPAGVYYLLVADEADMPTGGQVTVAVTIHNPACGNGAVEGTERCDDGNTMNGDGCSSACTFEPAGSISGPPGGMTFSGTLTALGDADAYQVTMTAPGFIIARTGQPTLGTCDTFDLDLFLIDDAGMTLGSDTFGCPSFVGQPFTQVPAGTFIVRLASTTTITQPYQIELRAVGLGCGNTLVEGTEQCDDGNTTSGDGCSATCTYEPIATVMGPGNPQTLSNELDTAGESDIFQVTMAAAGFIVVDTGVPTLGMCPMDLDLEVELLDSAFMPLGTRSFGCPSIGPADAFSAVMAGTYYVRVAVSGFSTVPTVAAYQVRIQGAAAGCGNGLLEPMEACDDGNTAANDGCNAMCQFEGTPRAESEPNNDRMTGDNSGAGRNRVVLNSGAITPAGDVDFYAITVPAGNPVRLTIRTFSALMDANNCTDDTVITLYDSMGNMLTEDDDGGPGTCSLIENDPAATNLAAGTYYLSVIEYNNDDTIASYFLSIDMR